MYLFIHILYILLLLVWVEALSVMRSLTPCKIIVGFYSFFEPRFKVDIRRAEA